MDRREFLTSVAAGGLAWLPAPAADPPSPTLPGDFVGDGTREGRYPGKSPIPTRPLGKTGIEVTVLGLGGFTGMKEPRTASFDPVGMAEAAIDAGVRYFDTAPAYNEGQSERNYGEVLARRRSEVFLATKTGQRTYDGALREVEASLKRLRTDRVDLLQIHSTRADEDLAAWGKPDGVLRALEKLRAEKVTRLIGVTGHESAETMRRAIEMYDFDVVFTTFNPMAKRRPFIEQVIPVALKKKMGILAMKVMGGAYGSLAKGNPPKNDGAPNHDDAAQQADAGDLIRYVLALPVSVAIVGSASLAQLRTNVAAAREAPLDEAARKALETRMN